MDITDNVPILARAVPDFSTEIPIRPPPAPALPRYLPSYPTASSGVEAGSNRLQAEPRRESLSQQASMFRPSLASQSLITSPSSDNSARLIDVSADRRLGEPLSNRALPSPPREKASNYPDGENTYQYQTSSNATTSSLSTPPVPDNSPGPREKIQRFFSKREPAADDQRLQRLSELDMRKSLRLQELFLKEEDLKRRMQTSFDQKQLSLLQHKSIRPHRGPSLSITISSDPKREPNVNNNSSKKDLGSERGAHTVRHNVSAERNESSEPTEKSPDRRVLKDESSVAQRHTPISGRSAREWRDIKPPHATEELDISDPEDLMRATFAERNRNRGRYIYLSKSTSSHDQRDPRLEQRSARTLIKHRVPLRSEDREKMNHEEGNALYKAHRRGIERLVRLKPVKLKVYHERDKKSNVLRQAAHREVRRYRGRENSDIETRGISTLDRSRDSSTALKKLNDSRLARMDAENL